MTFELNLNWLSEKNNKNPIYIKNISKIHKMMPGVTTRLEQHGVTPGYLLIHASLHQR
jgi:hypothetical protein